MAYTPTEWATGDVITAAKLNKAEQGIADAGPLIVRIASYDPETSYAILDASFKDIYDAVSAGRHVMLQDEQTEKNVTIQYLMSTTYNDAQGTLYPYEVNFADNENSFMCHAANETDILKQWAV